MTEARDNGERNFARNYLAAINALELLSDQLVLIGMAGNRTLEMFRQELMRHGAMTYRDMERPEPSRSNPLGLHREEIPL